MASRSARHPYISQRGKIQSWKYDFNFWVNNIRVLWTPLYIKHFSAYMQQEEDWDREGLLDPAWERQQRKVCPISDKSLLIEPNDRMHFYYFLQVYNIHLPVIVGNVVKLWMKKRKMSGFASRKRFGFPDLLLGEIPDRFDNNNRIIGFYISTIRRSSF